MNIRHWFTQLILCGALAAAAGGASAEELYELYLQALDKNPVLKGRQFAVERSQAQADQAYSKLLPQLAALGNYSLNRFETKAADTESYDGLRGTLSFRQPLFDRPSRLRLQSAEALTLQSQQEVDATRMSVVREVVDRYLEVLAAEDEITHVEAEKEQTQVQFNRLRDMFELQLVKITDVYEVQAYLQTLNTKTIDAINAKEIALERLLEITGLAVRNAAPLMQQSFPLIDRPDVDWVQEAVKNNPSLIALRHALDSERSNIDSSKAQHLPQLDLTASLTYADTGYDNRLNPRYNVGTIGVQLTLPIYEGGRVDASVREATARYRIAQELYEQKRREVERATRTIYLQTTSSHARVEATNQEVFAQEKAFQSQKEGYALGVSTVVDVLDAQRRVYRSLVEQSKARYDYIRNLVELRIWTGTLGHKDIKHISEWIAGRVDNPEPEL